VKPFVLPTIFTAVDRFSSPVAKINRQLKSVSQSAAQVSKTTAIMGAAILAPLVLAGREAVLFEDRMADVAKTSGLAGKGLLGLGEDILTLSASTRTPIEGLQKIAEIGGQMGITGRKGILQFTDSVNKFNVALGGDFSGGVDEAARAIGGLNVLFKETRGLEVADSITRIGSAINSLSAKGVQVPEVTEFIKRVGALPDAIKPAVQDVAALGAVFNKAGITAEISSRATADVLLTASKAPAAFAKQMGIATSEVKRMLNTNPAEFLKEFSKGLNGLSAIQFAKISDDLDLKDSGSIKILGALASSTKMLTEFQKISNDEFSKGTSLINEYNVKNETMAAKLARSKNNFQALSIMIGTELLPIIGDLLKEVMPVIKSFTIWVKENKPLVTTILKLAIGAAGLMFAISALSAMVSIFTKAMMILNIIMSLNPIALLVIAIAALIAGIILAIKYFDQWGSILLMMLGPFAIIVNQIMIFKNNWDMIIKSFKENGIISGLIAIGKTLLDTVLYPMQQLMELIAKFTGADWAKSAAGGIKDLRSAMGVNMGGGEERESLNTSVNPQQERNDAMEERMQGGALNRVALDIATRQGTTANVTSNKGGIPIKLKSSHTFGQ
jgi:TP901 family phage tail tape measure protein